MTQALLADKATDQIQSLVNLRTDPWEFLSNWVYTEDQVDRLAPIKKFPYHLDYLKYLTSEWMQEDVLLVPKSRRMIMTWWAISVHLWATMFFRSRLTFFISKKENDSDDLVERAYFVYTHVPDEFKEAVGFWPEAKRTYCKLSFPEIRSQIIGVPQGSDQLRQRTASFILADEMAFWEHARDVYGASLPTLEGGGKLTCISSAYPGFFKDLVFDDLKVW